MTIFCGCDTDAIKISNRRRRNLKGQSQVLGTGTAKYILRFHEEWTIHDQEISQTIYALCADLLENKILKEQFTNCLKLAPHK